MSNTSNIEELRALAESLSPQELADHAELACVYNAACVIAISSYSGTIATPRVTDVPDERQELIRTLFDRFDDGRGWIEFPFFYRDFLGRDRVDHVTVAASGVKAYRYKRHEDPQTHEPIGYFTSFPTY